MQTFCWSLSWVFNSILLIVGSHVLHFRKQKVFDQNIKKINLVKTLLNTSIVMKTYLKTLTLLLFARDIEISKKNMTYENKSTVHLKYQTRIEKVYKRT